MINNGVEKLTKWNLAFVPTIANAVLLPLDVVEHLDHDDGHRAATSTHDTLF